METINILVVEDEDALFNGYVDSAQELSDASLNIQLARGVTAEEASRVLVENEFHGAIIDLNLLGDTNSEDPSGVCVISEILTEYRIPIIVVSGNLQNLPEKFDPNEHEFLKSYDRDTQNKIIFEDILRIFKTGILKVIGGKGLIEKNLNTVFWSHLSKDIDAWYDESDDVVERSLLRYTINHLLAYLDKSDDGSHNSYHEAEFYLKEPIKNIISPGDIVVNPITNDRYILLSPACDVEVRQGVEDTINAKSLMLGKIYDSRPESLVDKGLLKRGHNKSDVRSLIGKVVKGQEAKFIFLPKYKELGEGIINFQDLLTINFNEYRTYQRLATVSVSFFKDIQSRFASYYGRQGMPDLNKTGIIENYIQQHYPTA